MQRSPVASPVLLLQFSAMCKKAKLMRSANAGLKNCQKRELTPYLYLCLIDSKVWGFMNIQFDKYNQYDGNKKHKHVNVFFGITVMDDIHTCCCKNVFS